MVAAVPSTASVAPTGPGGPAARPSSGAGGVSFHDVLSCLNPLHYLPFIGPLYRAMTGDKIPEAVRAAGSFVASGLMGGPIGLAVNAATTAFEKVAGIDEDRVGRALLAQAGIAAPEPAPSTPSLPSAPSSPAPSAGSKRSASILVKADPASLALSPSQLAAYGVGAARDGSLVMSDLVGAEVLNAIELTRHGTMLAAAAYGGARDHAGPVSLSL